MQTDTCTLIKLPCISATESTVNIGQLSFRGEWLQKNINAKAHYSKRQQPSKIDTVIHWLIFMQLCLWGCKGNQKRQKRRANIAANYRAFKSRIRTERIPTQADQEKVVQAIPEFSSRVQPRLLQVFGFVINLHTIFLMMDGDAKKWSPRGSLLWASHAWNSIYSLAISREFSPR